MAGVPAFRQPTDIAKFYQSIQRLNGNIIHTISRFIDCIMSAIANSRHD
ncbi:MAG: hypothetical protein PHU14_14645 [Methylovulum sp.]|nr:hypothetical protein [Methylovulum sp.]